jgi:50S ribosomal protein L16 3-hydroxylase
VPEARLDDLMVSWASDGGGVGPHLDAYDVFLLQVQGRRRWRIGRVRRPRFVPGAAAEDPAHFEPEQEWVLEPGDMLYLPPRWGHDGVAEGGDCMTCSVGFRAPARPGGSCWRLADELAAAGRRASAGRARLYRDPGQPATATPGAACPRRCWPSRARPCSARWADPRALERALGEWLTEPKPRSGSRPTAAGRRAAAPACSGPRSRMLYDDRHVFINGEAFRMPAAATRG